jgi:opacity protein-like surface antigen
MPVRVIPMMTRLFVFGVCAVLAAAPCRAQETVEGPISIGALGGIAVGHDHGGGTVGATIVVDLGRRLSIEARGMFLDRGRLETAVEGTANLLVRLAIDRKVAPYVAVGGGVYHAMYDFGDIESLDTDDWTRMMGGLFGNRFMPDFPWGRMRPIIDQFPRMRDWDSSTDPAFSFGGGIDIAVTPSLYVRPDFRALMIFSRDTYTIGSATFSVGYRF